MRSAFIGLAVYRDGEKRYVILPKNIGAEGIIEVRPYRMHARQ